MKIKFKGQEYDKIFVFGGGTGIYLTVDSLKKIDKRIGDKIIQVVAMSDDGGSTGRIMNHYPGLLPPGDLRRAYAAACNKLKFVLTDRINDKKANESGLNSTDDLTLGNILKTFYGEESEQYIDITKNDALRRILNHSFLELKGSGLGGHSIGNLIITAAMLQSESLENALSLLDTVFDVSGNIYPVTDELNHVEVIYENGEVERHENNLDKLRPYYSQIMRFTLVSEETNQIPRLYGPLTKELADSSRKLGIISQGSLYASVISSLIPAKKHLKDMDFIVVINNINNPQSIGMSAQEHLETIQKYGGLNNVVGVIYNQPNEEYITDDFQIFVSTKGWNLRICQPVAGEINLPCAYRADIAMNKLISLTNPGKLGNAFKEIGLEVTL